jgi:hypothetical protein
VVTSWGTLFLLYMNYELFNESTPLPSTPGAPQRAHGLVVTRFTLMVANVRCTVKSSATSSCAGDAAVATT